MLIEDSRTLTDSDSIQTGPTFRLSVGCTRKQASCMLSYRRFNYWYGWAIIVQDQHNFGLAADCFWAPLEFNIRIPQRQTSRNQLNEERQSISTFPLVEQTSITFLQRSGIYCRNWWACRTILFKSNLNVNIFHLLHSGLAHIHQQSTKLYWLHSTAHHVVAAHIDFLYCMERRAVLYHLRILNYRQVCLNYGAFSLSNGKFLSFTNNKSFGL